MPSDEQPHQYQWTPQQTPDWFATAACRGQIELFFPRESELWDPNPAIAICDTCSSREACLEYGLDERHGVWGGTTARERRQIRKTRRRAA